MPTTYAHYRFGRQVLSALPQETQALIQRHQNLFDFGVHGPDLLFYYQALRKNPVSQLGYDSHARTGRDFFTQAVGTAQAAPDREAAWAYLYGVLCHFTLDRECHPYVGEKEKTGVSHSAIEASFDRYLLELDHLDPVLHRVTQHLHPSLETAQVIAQFYPPLEGKTVYTAQKSMRWLLNLLIAKGPKRWFVCSVMRLAGKANLQDLFNPLTPNPATRDSDEILLHHYQDALVLAGELFPQLEALGAGTGSLGPGFDHTFGET